MAKQDVMGMALRPLSPAAARGQQAPTTMNGIGRFQSIGKVSTSVQLIPILYFCMVYT